MMEIHHKGAITQLYDDVDSECYTFDNITYCETGYEIDYDPHQYIALLDKYDDRDVFLEESYFQWEPTGWYLQPYSNLEIGGKHYLGFLKTIDYAKQYANSVHDVIAPYSGTTESHLHTDISIPNANLQWFQAYASIIHGAEGIWFWCMHGLWESDEDKDYWKNSTNNAKFARTYFPRRYKDYISNLARELSYLKDRDLLNQDSNTEVHTKTDHFDDYGIVPSYSTYINSNHITKDYSLLQADHKSENYGLRYTIRSNGHETYMIITNPLPVAIQNVLLNFGHLTDPNIRYA